MRAIIENDIASRTDAYVELEAKIATKNLGIIITNHSCFDYVEIARTAPLVFDTRNATAGITGKKFGEVVEVG